MSAVLIFECEMLMLSLGKASTCEIGAITDPKVMKNFRKDAKRPCMLRKKQKAHMPSSVAIGQRPLLKSEK
jgi:hypothetical protein